MTQRDIYVGVAQEPDIALRRVRPSLNNPHGAPASADTAAGTVLTTSDLSGKSLTIIPADSVAATRRSRAGNTVRRQQADGTWAPINLGSDGRRFRRQQLTTKLHPDARAALDQMAADAGLRVCEVLERLIYAAQRDAVFASQALANPARD